MPEKPQITGILPAVGTSPFDPQGDLQVSIGSKALGHYKGAIHSDSGIKLLIDLVPEIGAVQQVIIKHDFGTPQIRVGTVGNVLINQDFATMQIGQSVVGQQNWVQTANLPSLAGSMLARQYAIGNGLVSAWVSLPGTAGTVQNFVSRMLPQVTGDGTPYYFRWRWHPTSLLPAPSKQYYRIYPGMSGTGGVLGTPDYNDTYPFLVAISKDAGSTLWIDDNTSTFAAMHNLGAIALDTDHVFEVYVDAAGALKMVVDNAAVIPVFTGTRKAADHQFDHVTFGWVNGTATPTTNASGWDFIYAAEGDAKTSGMLVPNGTSITLEGFHKPMPADQIAIASVNAAAPNPSVEILVVGA